MITLSSKWPKASLWPLVAVYSLLLLWAAFIGMRWLSGIELELSTDTAAPITLRHLSGLLAPDSDDAKTTPTSIMIVIGSEADAIEAVPIVLELQRRRNEKSMAEAVPVLVRAASGADRPILDALGVSVASVELDYVPGADLGAILTDFQDVLSAYRPARLLVLDDSTVALAAALAAFYAKIPVGQLVEGGDDTHPNWTVHRSAICDVATWRFATTTWVLDRLQREGRAPNSIVRTGSPAVDAVRTLRRLALPPADSLVDSVLTRIKEIGSTVVLLTTEREAASHQAEIVRAVRTALDANPDLVVVYIVDDFDNDDAVNSESSSRLLLLRRRPASLSFPDLVLLMEAAIAVVSDCDRRLSQALTLGKTVVQIGRNSSNSAYPEAVHDGALIVVPRPEALEDALADLFVHVPVGVVDVLGGGDAAQLISEALLGPIPIASSATGGGALEHQRDRRPILVLALTVWHRAMLETQLSLIRDQLGLGAYALRIVVYQNGAHLNVTEIVGRWASPDAWAPDFDDVRLIHIHSSVETGYYGRFLAPLAVEVADADFFILFDDDILFGRRYLANMLRVVRAGSLATRNGRFITPGMDESGGCSFTGRGDLFFDDDIRYDYGGHIWAGRLGWLRAAWRHPPPTFMHNEDFWLSAVLKTQLNVTTKKPRCPRPVGGRRSRPEFCACSARNAIEHIDPVVGDGATADYKQRLENYRLFINAYNYQLIALSEPDLLQRECDTHHFVEYGSVWILDEPRFQDCYSWV